MTSPVTSPAARLARRLADRARSLLALRLRGLSRRRTAAKQAVAEQAAAEHAAAEAEAAERAAAERAELEAELVLELALRIGERLLGAGQGAADVEAAMRIVLAAYGLADCEPQVTFTMISVSRQVGAHAAPVTIGRTVRSRSPDYRRLLRLYALIEQIAGGELDSAQARERIDELDAIARRREYPRWLTVLAPGLLAASASLMVTGRSDARAWITFAVAFGAAITGDRFAAALASVGVPALFLTAVAALPASAAGVGMALTGAGLGGSAVVTGSLFALFPGRSLVGAVEDGLTGFYVTAAARFIEVIYLVVGIILGVLAILPAGVRLGATFKPEGGLTPPSGSPLQYPAAALLAASLAVLVGAPRRVLPVHVVGGVIAWAIFQLLAVTWDVNPIFATGVGAAAVACLGQLVSRHHFSPLPYITGSLGPLLPGSALYTGVLYLGQGKAVDGVADLSRAGAIALALAVGVSLITESVRLARNWTRPVDQFEDDQFETDQFDVSDADAGWSSGSARRGSGIGSP